MKIILTGGGTAGHVTPALAIAELFRQNIPSSKILYVGTPTGMERRLVKEAGYPYHAIEASGFYRSLTPRNLRSAWLALTSPQKAKKLLKNYEPDLVIGTGGYVSWPVLSAATALGLPTALHESNAIPGLTVRRLAGRVDLVLLNFIEAQAHLPRARRIEHVGNPLRGGFSHPERDTARKRLGIPEEARLTVSFGGSLGSEALNHAMIGLFSRYTLESPTAWHIHGTGTRYFREFEAEVTKAFGALPERIRFSAYLSDMPTLMAAADLLICRAGAMTVSEIARVGRASILVPSPHVAEDHQTKNAMVLANSGAAILLPEHLLTEERLTNDVRSVLEDAPYQRRIETAASAFDIPDANKRVYESLVSIIK